MKYTIDERGSHYMIEDNEADKQAAEQAQAEPAPREMTLKDALVTIAAVARQVEAIGT